MSRRLILSIAALALLAGACVAGDNGPWVNERGELISNAVLLEYQGLHACDQRDITYFQVFGRQYAKDPLGLLGQLVSEDGLRDLTYDESTVIPDTAEATGITHGNRELYFNEPDIDDYLYIVIDGRIVERWPRAEFRCTVGL